MLTGDHPFTYDPPSPPNPTPLETYLPSSLFCSSSPFHFIHFLFVNCLLIFFFLINRSIDHKVASSVFATSGTTVQLWDHNRSKAIRTFAWGSDTATKVKFNQIEPDVSFHSLSPLLLFIISFLLSSCSHALLGSVDALVRSSIELNLLRLPPLPLFSLIGFLFFFFFLFTDFVLFVFTACIRI